MPLPDARPLRIAILAHSTNPRGGVVHALELGDALVRLGHEAVVHAPDPDRIGFFRETLCRTVSLPASPPSMDLAKTVQLRVSEYQRHFDTAGNRRFDVFHAQDSISGNALAQLKAGGLISGFARTVHHLDIFDGAELMALQARAIIAADKHFVVSQHWRAQLAAEFGIDSEIVGNGVDLSRYSSSVDERDVILRHRLGLGEGPVYLAIGGIEARKNTLRILHAFCRVHERIPAAQLVIAGGASLLNHRSYREEFDTWLADSGLPAGAVFTTGVLPHRDMPALYRLADALVFPSVREGFGLVVLEAMASGLPVIVSRITPFTEYLGIDDAAWCDPFDTDSIASAMQATRDPSRRRALIQRGKTIAERHDWLKTARAHLAGYADIRALWHA
jgi:glycosyltransferase-like protein